MKRIAFSLAAFLFVTSGAFAADPAKTGDTTAGKVFTDDKGMTLYTYDKDAKGKSNCNDQCAKAWPPFAAAADAKADGKWTIVDRGDGTKMWAYDDKPLYTFARDKKAGDITGDKAGGVWHIAKAE
jgi:predicted lipoprotein with Yx(FWY)xxD motif